jgi:hypothetical protein
MSLEFRHPPEVSAAQSCSGAAGVPGSQVAALRSLTMVDVSHITEIVLGKKSTQPVYHGDINDHQCRQCWQTIVAQSEHVTRALSDIGSGKSGTVERLAGVPWSSVKTLDGTSDDDHYSQSLRAACDAMRRRLKAPSETASVLLVSR